MEEKVYYDDFGIKITNRRVIHGEDQKTTAISQINSVSTAKSHIKVADATDHGKILGLVIGIILGVAQGVIVENLFFSWFLFFLFPFLGILIGFKLDKDAVFEDIYGLRIITSSGSTNAFQHSDKEIEGFGRVMELQGDAFQHSDKSIVDRMVEALNQAIIENLNTKEQTQQPQPKQESSGSGDKISKLKSLGEMLQAGLLTQEEFDKEKKKLLGD